MKLQRIDGLDIFRGFAILAMMIYHFTYDLNHFHIVSLHMNQTLEFRIIRYIIVSMFLLSVGMSLALVHKEKLKWSSIRKRIFTLGLASLTVTITTYMMFPHSWVYFGILHFILIASLITISLLKFPKVLQLFVVLIAVGTLTKTLHMHGLYAELQIPLSLPTHTEDLLPLFPWIAVVFIGAIIVHYGLHKTIFTSRIFNTSSKFQQILKKMGQHSLLIYLIHQPIIFGAFELYFMITK